MGRTSERSRVVILGGGFAGLAAALELEPGRHDVTLVDRQRWFEFLPNIHELVSGVKTPDLLRLPLDRNLARAGHAFVRDTVTAIDPAARTVTTRRRKRPIGYDALIVGLGGVNNTQGVPGVDEHAFPFKSVDQCQRIGTRLRRLASRRKTTRVVIVGGGLEGVEALGEILRRHRDDDVHVSVVDVSERLLSETPDVLDRHVRELCAAQAVDLALGSRVDSVAEDAVVLEDGRRLPSDLTIWTGGPTAPALLAESGLAPRGEWAPVDVTLQSKGHPEVFVAGDAAELPTPLSKQAYHAIDMGVCAARNAGRLLAHRALEPFEPSGKPTLISFGDLSCFLVAGERVLAGSALGPAKEAVFELVMAQLDAQPWWARLPRMARRVDRAARQLLWPSVSSLDALCRQGRISLLSVD
ncbi:MAG: NAD(P)/FAD-dependent oxidoreductase [Myxococcota bacterium]